MRSGVGRVDAPLIELELESAERRHAVDHQQRAEFIGDGFDRWQLLQDTRRSLGVHHTKEVEALPPCGVTPGVGLDRPAPFTRHLDHLGSTAPRNFSQTRSEDAVHADQDALTGFDQVDQASLHPRRTGA